MAELCNDDQWAWHEPDCMLSADGDLENLELGQILDVTAIQAMANDFFSLTGIPMFIEDLRGKTLVAVGWQEICTKFHRLHPDARKNCIRGTLVAQGGAERGFRLHRCNNNLWEGVTRIMLGERHVGNIVAGQFLFADEEIDYEYFRAQARQYGFDEPQYLAALERVPLLQREQVDVAIAFFIKFAQLLSSLSFSSIKLARSSTQIRRMNAELEATVKELEAFTYSVSHDMRAPLRHIRGFSKILIEEFSANFPEEAQRLLHRIEQGTRHMDMLVGDLLKLAHIGRRELTMQACGLRSLVDEVILEFKPECEGREIDWKVGSLPFVECDPGLVKQVFQNLLGNALKFTRPRARALIEIGQLQEEAPPVIYVGDNGVGFSMKYADKLFGVFQRLHRQEDFEGTGVGLASVQRIIQKHGGRIWAEAELDKGATFYFTLAAPQETEKKILLKNRASVELSAIAPATS